MRRVATLIGQCVQKIVPIKGTNDQPRVQCCVQPQVVGITQTMVSPNASSKRDHGAARWASRSEINQMKTGLELCLDKVSGRAVRVSIEGNLLAIAPPRSGKTSGVVIPNLVFPEPKSLERSSRGY